jgi:hypothetical protein
MLCNYFQAFILSDRAAAASWKSVYRGLLNSPAGVCAASEQAELFKNFDSSCWLSQVGVTAARGTLKPSRIHAEHQLMGKLFCCPPGTKCKCRKNQSILYYVQQTETTSESRHFGGLAAADGGRTIRSTRPLLRHFKRAKKDRQIGIESLKYRIRTFSLRSISMHLGKWQTKIEKEDITLVCVYNVVTLRM